MSGETGGEGIDTEIEPWLSRAQFANYTLASGLVLEAISLGLYFGGEYIFPDHTQNVNELSVCGIATSSSLIVFFVACISIAIGLFSFLFTKNQPAEDENLCIRLFPFLRG